MAKLPYRQVHLDFHTSEDIHGIGSRFSKENFIEALQVGHINSITVFSKCHHGWAYHPTKVNRQHPNLNFDLLGAQLDACREAGVRAEVYLSAGLDEKYAREHTECLRTNRDGGRGNFLRPGYHRLCFGTPYLDQLCAEVEEVLQVYGDRFDGLFLDIVGIQPCYCQYCLDGMRKAGLDPENEADARAYAKQVYFRYTQRIAALVEKYRPGMPIIHNDGGAIFQGRDIAYCNTGHFELESLPTGGWGYDHFPRAAAYARTLGKEFLGMTGKFHRSWGEFGGYKHPNALRYEAALANACGARCSVGDQLHPDGEADLATYRLIGAAYAEVEAREPWLTDAVNVADIGLIAAETCGLRYDDGSWRQDIGANRIMLEGHYLYDIVDFAADLTAYRMLVLPDNITIDAPRKAKLDAYLAQGGKLLLTGKSGTDESGAFAFDFGVTFGGAGEYKPAYLRPAFPLYPNGRTNYVMYETNYDAAPTEAFTGQIIAERVDPYFNRTAEHFCSHRHTPYDREKTAPAVFVTEQIAYIGWDIFAEYANEGAVHLRALVTATIDQLLTGDGKSLQTDLPSCGVTALWRQGARLVHHLVYAIPKRRGNGIEVIEDLPTVHDVMSVVRVPKQPSRVYLAPEGTELPFEYAGGCVRYTLPSLTCSALVVIENKRRRPVQRKKVVCAAVLTVILALSASGCAREDAEQNALTTQAEPGHANAGTASVSTETLAAIDALPPNTTPADILAVPTSTFEKIDALPQDEASAIMTTSPVGGTPKYYVFAPGLTYYRYDKWTDQYHVCTLSLPEGFTDGQIISAGCGGGSGEVDLTVEARKGEEKVYLDYYFYTGDPTEGLSPVEVAVLDEQAVAHLFEGME